VIVQDQTAPIFSGCILSDVEVFADGSCEATANWIVPTAIDNCSVPIVASTYSPGNIFPLGTTTVTYTATDASGNSSTCVFDVVVIDNSTPLISGCNATDIFAIADGSCGSSVSWTIPTATDNCGTPTLVGSHDPGDIFFPGTTVVTYTATDLAGNISTCIFNVIVTDETAPVISGCITSDILVYANSSCEAPVSWTEPTATDNCSVQSLITTHPTGSTFELGTTLVKYTATDASGNITECSFNVIVKDNIGPVISGCPAGDIIMVADATCQAVANWTAPTVSDNCLGVTLTSSHDSGDAFPKGTTQVVYTATDGSGNTSTCSFNVMVTDSVDPLISGCFATDIIAVATASCESPVNWVEPVASDNCGTVTTTRSHRPGDIFRLGRTTVTYSATDASGNTATCSFDVDVVDGAPPVFAPCANVIVTAGPACETTVSWPAPIVTDCSNVSVVSSHNPGDVFSKGSTDVTYTATDSYGNSSSCTFKVIVEDIAPPVFQNCVNDMVINASAQCEAVVNWVAPAAIDNCGTVALESTHDIGNTFPLGPTKVIYTARDDSGNTAICEFTVTVRNETIPVFENCPDDIRLTANEFGEIVGEWSLPVVTSICGEIILTGSHNSGDIFSIGSTTVEYQATDISGNLSRCRFNVIVDKQEIDIGISQVVTPDGNGVNDEWILTNIEKFSRNEIVIVDRWGSVIYAAAGYNNGNIVWKGISQNGGTVPTGTYFYRLTVRYGQDSMERTGFVELIR
jgi:gliding motility-associated-like protein